MPRIEGRRRLPGRRALEAEDGATATEYAVMLAVIVAAIVAVLGLSNGPLQRFWRNANAMFGPANPGNPGD